MTFVVTAALLIGLLVMIPLLAHLLRRGRARDLPFPPTHLVPTREHVAKRRSRFEDRALLALRASIILLLALLGATPLIRCDRAVFNRHAGASIAAIIVLDDSASMRNELPDGLSRFERGKRAALELVDQMGEGDSFGLVLAGRPARIQLLPSSNPELLRRQLTSTVVTDRATDLASAIALGESAIDRLPHRDKRVIVLSDLRGELPRLSSRVTHLLPELSAPSKNCAVVSAFRSRGRISAEVACSNDYPSDTRHLQLVRAKHPGEVVREMSVPLRAGRDSFTIADDATREESVLVMQGQDDNPHDNRAPVVDGGLGPEIATYSDPVTGRGTTGGPPIVEQALRAFNPNLSIRPLATVPEELRELADVELLLLDDPPLISAESRGAILGFVERGGTAVAMFGPSADSARLGSLLLPFIERRATWENTAPAGLDPASLSSLGAAAASLSELAPKGRLSFDESHDPNVKVRGRWVDHKAFWIERPIGRGLAIALGLPASIGQSDLALRSGFIALLEQILATRERLGLARVTTVGTAWRFVDKGQGDGFPRSVEGPSGSLRLDNLDRAKGSERILVPNELGRYRVQFADHSEARTALLPAEEVLEPVRHWPVVASQKPNKAAGRLDITRQLAMALLALFALELAWSSAAFRGFLGRRWQTLAARIPSRNSRRAL